MVGLHLLGSVQISQAFIVRKLDNILQELDPLAEQGNIEGFFNNAKNADKLTSLVDGIREAVMDYQVCNWNQFIVLASDIFQTSLQQEMYDQSCQLIVGLSLLPSGCV